MSTITATAPTWTRERPTAPGWYWMRTPEFGPTVIRFREAMVGGLVGMMLGSPNAWRPHEFEAAEWAGPIPEPEGGCA